MKCDYCGADEDLPFTCNYCGGTFCAEHRLPESHACTGDTSRPPVVVNPNTSFSWRGSTYSTTAPSGRRAHIFSGIEVRDILIAWVALALAFTLAQTGVRGLMQFRNLPMEFFVAFVAVGSGFVLHELMHKFTAERYGYWAEFRMWVFGILLALLTSIGGFIFAAPGATYIQGYNVTDRENGIISLAGPLTNIVISIVFLLLLLVGHGLLAIIGQVGFTINLILATFNMLPIMPLDGAKVFRWNKVYWTAVFVPLALVVVWVFFVGSI